VIQQNASASEEMAGMAEELSGESADLKSTIAYFKLGGEVAPAVAGPKERLADSQPRLQRPSHKIAGSSKEAAPPRAQAPKAPEPRRGIVPLAQPPSGEAKDSDFEEF
jgi:methyl-accepting chemotaxis protein